MQPLAMGRASFISGALLLRTQGIKNASFSHRVFTRRYVKGTAAASWDEAAEIYFSKNPDSQVAVEETAEKKKKPVPEVDPVIQRHSSREMYANEARFRDSGFRDAPKSRSRMDSSPKEAPKSRVARDSSLNEDSRIYNGSTSNPTWKLRRNLKHDGGKDNDDDKDDDGKDDDEPVAKRLDAGEAKVLPDGMQRVNRGYVRKQVSGFPILKQGGYQRRYRDEEEEERHSEVPKLRGEVVYGMGPVKTAIQARRRDLHVLYVQEGLEKGGVGKRKISNEVKGIIKMAEDIELKVAMVSKHVLNMLSDNRPHQGVLLDASSLEVVEVKSLDTPMVLNDKVPVWIALDEVQDPQNFGAIVRSAYFFGASGVVVCAKNSAPLSGTVSKASAGALEVMELLCCRNMVKFLRNSIINGWRVVGTTLDPDCVPVSDIPKNLPTIVVLGNEGVGIRSNVSNACSDLVRITGAVRAKKSKKKKDAAGDDGSASDIKTQLKKMLEVDAEEEMMVDADAVDSLNVSVAAGILLHEFINRNDV